MARLLRLPSLFRLVGQQLGIPLPYVDAEQNVDAGKNVDAEQNAYRIDADFSAWSGVLIMNSNLHKVRCAQRFRATVIVICFIAFPTFGSASIITTTFAHNNGQAGNMFDINVLAASGININAFDLNLDAGDWDIQIYTKTGSYAGSETTAGDWTLHDSITGLTSAGPGNATFWDFNDITNLTGANSFYVVVTNGSAMNYTNGTSPEGSIIADDGMLQILQGTGNAGLFGTQFRPRTWNGSIHYTAIPEPGTALVFAWLLGSLAICQRNRRWSN